MRLLRVWRGRCSGVGLAESASLILICPVACSPPCPRWCCQPSTATLPRGRTQECREQPGLLGRGLCLQSPWPFSALAARPLPVLGVLTAHVCACPQVPVQPVSAAGPEHSKPLEKAESLFGQERDPRFSEIYSSIGAGREGWAARHGWGTSRLYLLSPSTPVLFALSQVTRSSSGCGGLA